MSARITPLDLFKFVGRRNPFSRQTENGGYIPVRRNLTIIDLTRHLNGEETLGTYVIREDGLINFACIDIDGEVGNDMAPMKELGDYIMTLFPEFDRCMEFSGRRGYHIWLFPKEPEQPRFMRELIKSRFRANGVSLAVEIYPKQNKVDATRKQLGNLIKIPEGKHKKGGWSKILEWQDGKN